MCLVRILSLKGIQRETGIFLTAFLGNGSLDFNFLVEMKLGFPLNPQKVEHFLQGGQQQPSLMGNRHKGLIQFG